MRTAETGPSPGLRRATRALLAALALSLLLVVVLGSEGDAVVGDLGGDYVSFYAAGELVVDDRGALYDPDAQAERQHEALGTTADDGQFFFGYPPYFAVPYGLLAQLPFRVSYAVHTFVMAGLLVLGLHILRPLAPLVDRYFEQAVAAALLFYPMFKAVTGGQNTALTFVLLAAVLRGVSEDRQVLAGTATALLLVKPQFALPVAGLLLVSRRWRAVAVFTGGAAVLYLVGAAISGWTWPSEWYDTVRWLDAVDTPFNVQNAVSWLGFSEAVFGIDARVAEIVGWTLALATAAGLAWLWATAARRGSPASSRRLPLVAAVTAPALVLMPPHVIYYDAGIVLIALAVVAVPVLWSAAVRRIVAAMWIVALTQVWSADLGVAPVFAVVVAVLAWAGWLAVGPDRLDSYVAQPDLSPSPNRS